MKYIMKYIKLFEEFSMKPMFSVKKELPKRGFIVPANKNELLALIEYFEELGFIEGYNPHAATRTYLNSDWGDYLPDVPIFQWETFNDTRHSDKDDKHIFVFTDDLKSGSMMGAELLKFNDYFDLKPEFRGHKLQKFNL